nr:hypothetical protein CFP56_79659 [Quercus suber]
MSVENRSVTVKRKIVKKKAKRNISINPGSIMGGLEFMAARFLEFSSHIRKISVRRKISRRDVLEFPICMDAKRSESEDRLVLPKKKKSKLRSKNEEGYRETEIYRFDNPSPGYSQSPFNPIHVDNRNGNENGYNGFDENGIDIDDGVFSSDSPVLSPPTEMEPEEGFALCE